MPMALLGARAPSDRRRHAGRVDGLLAIEACAVVARQCPPLRDGTLEQRAGRREGAPRQIGEGRLVGSHHAILAPISTERFADGSGGLRRPSP